MRGHIRRRGEHSFEIKLELEPDPSGKRRTAYISVKGNKRDAERRLAEELAKVATGTFVEPSKVAVGAFVRGRVDQWRAAGDISPRSHRRYLEVLNHQIAPLIGDKVIEKLSRLDLEAWHTELRARGLAPQTIRLAHRLLGKALTDAERDGMIMRNVCKLQRAPKVVASEVEIVRDIPALLAKLEGERLRTIAIVALFTGMRLGEILGLKDGRVHLDRGVIEVRASIDDRGELRPPKTRSGIRTITLPAIVIETLRAHRIAQLEHRMRVGAGRMTADDFVFVDVNGQPLKVSTTSMNWARLAAKIGVPITFHGLRHTHCSMLIASGIDVVTISKRLGHADPSITLKVYSHLFAVDDSKAAAAIDKALGAPA
jgi:integrase